MTDRGSLITLRSPQIWGFALLAMLGPSLSILVPRVMAGVLPVAALLAVVGFVVSQRRPLKMQLAPWVITTLVTVLCALSALWAPDALFVLDSTARMAGAFIGGLVLFFTAGELSEEQRRSLRVLLLGGFLFALALIGFNYVTQFALLKPFLSEKDILELPLRSNRGMVVLALLLWPALTAAQSLASNRDNWRRAALLLMPLAFLVSLNTDSQTAGASIVIASGVYFLARIYPRATNRLIAYGGGLLILALPCLVLLLRHFNPAIGFSWDAASGGTRLEIWYAVAEAVMRSPIIGHGMEAARFVSGWGMTHLYYPFDTILHPHNGVLQLWYEFGLVGAAAAAAIWLAVTRRIGEAPMPQIAASLALLSSVVLVSAISHGLWQSWWLGAVGLSPALMRMVRRAD